MDIEDTVAKSSYECTLFHKSLGTGHPTLITDFPRGKYARGHCSIHSLAHKDNLQFVIFSGCQYGARSRADKD